MLYEVITVRVEIPKWVADDPDKLNLLHAVLVDQCRMMGGKPYPYLLHRAHEIAVVKHEEKYQVEQMLAQELRRQNEELDEISSKQSAKDREGRTARITSYNVCYTKLLRVRNG